MSKAFIDRNQQQNSNNNQSETQAKIDPVAQRKWLNSQQVDQGWGVPAQMFASEEEEELVQGKTEDEELLQGKAEEEGLQMKGGPVKGGSSTQSGIPEDVRGKMENSFNADFSNVKVHANSSKAPEIGALAYTQGQDIHFAPGQYNPGTSAGQQLLGHELTHVVQQRQGRVKPDAEQKKGLPAGAQAKEGMIINSDTSLEKEADVMGAQAAQGKMANVAGKGSGVQMKGEENGPGKGLPYYLCKEDEMGGILFLLQQFYGVSEEEILKYNNLDKFDGKILVYQNMKIYLPSRCKGMDGLLWDSEISYDNGYRTKGMTIKAEHMCAEMQDQARDLRDGFKESIDIVERLMELKDDSVKSALFTRLFSEIFEGLAAFGGPWKYIAEGLKISWDAFKVVSGNKGENTIDIAFHKLASIHHAAFQKVISQLEEHESILDKSINPDVVGKVVSQEKLGEIVDIYAKIKVSPHTKTIDATREHEITVWKNVLPLKFKHVFSETQYHKSKSSISVPTEDSGVWKHIYRTEKGYGETSHWLATSGNWFWGRSPQKEITKRLFKTLKVDKEDLYCNWGIEKVKHELFEVNSKM